MHLEWRDPAYPYTIILLNAFAFDVYIAIEQQGTIIFKGYNNIDRLLTELASVQEPIRFIGNGATLYQHKIIAALGNRAVIPESNPPYCSLEQIGKLGYAQWQDGNKGVQQLLPLYLKQHQVHTK